MHSLSIQMFRTLKYFNNMTFYIVLFYIVYVSFHGKQNEKNSRESGIYRKQQKN